MNAFDDAGILMVRMNEAEALKTIQSIAEQLLSKNPNCGRYEKHLDDGRDFSIAVRLEIPEESACSVFDPYIEQARTHYEEVCRLRTEEREG